MTDLKESQDYLAQVIAERDELRQQCDRLADALKPFAHDDLSVEFGGNQQGNKSPIYGRLNAILTLGDFRNARAALASLQHKEQP